MAESGAAGRPTPARIWSLAVDRHAEDDVVVLVLRGRIGSRSAAALTDAASREIPDGRRVLIDLAGVDYVSSAGLDALQSMAGRIHASGGTVVLCALTEPVRIVFDLAGMLSSFTLSPTRAAGMARLRGPGVSSSGNAELSPG
jgi:anti-anti-sigma factor